MLEINGTLIAIVINFIILVYVLNYFLYKPVLKVLSDRKTHIETVLAEAEAKMAQARASVDEGIQVVNKANITSKKIVDEANSAAAEIKKNELDRTKKEIEEQMKRARNEIEQYKIEARRAALRDASKLSVMIAEKIIGKRLSQKGQRALIDNFIDGLGR